MEEYGALCDCVDGPSVRVLKSVEPFPDAMQGLKIVVRCRDGSRRSHLRHTGTL